MVFFQNHHKCYRGVDVQSVEWKDDMFYTQFVHDDQSLEIQSESLLVATGVRPNTDELGLGRTNITCDQRGHIQVNDYMQTSVKHIYAIGDCVGKHYFRHNVNFEGEYLFAHLFKDKHDGITYPPMPHAVFTHPQIAGVGYTEEELNQQKIPYVIGRNQYSKSAMGMALRSSSYSEHNGLVKLLFSASSPHYLIGAHIVGKEAATMCHMLIAYMQCNACLSDLLNTIYIHPALSENIRNAARNVSI